jgi:hypothetical protein
VYRVGQVHDLWRARGLRVRGSPARAGMDPCCRGAAWRPAGLPRSRGDGPRTTRLNGVAATAPPLARGWTPHTATARVSVRGSPARAGMDPLMEGILIPDARLPRSRGDGPTVDVPSIIGGLAPPLARGWTLSERIRLSRQTGSPARAGMDPSRTTLARGSVWLPRSRGDGPPVLSTRLPRSRGWTPGLGDPYVIREVWRYAD